MKLRDLWRFALIFGMFRSLSIISSWMGVFDVNTGTTDLILASMVTTILAVRERPHDRSS